MRHATRAAVKVLVVVVALAANARAQEPARESPTTDHDVIDDVLSFGQRFVVDAYRDRGRRDPRWDADALKLLEAQLPAEVNANWSRFYHVEGVTPLADRLALGQRILDAGCDDAIVCYQVGRARTEARQDANARLAYDRAFAAVEGGSPYAPVYQLLIAIAYHDAHARRGDEDHDAEMYRKIDRLYAQAMSDPATLPSSRRAVWAVGRLAFSDPNSRWLNARGDGVAGLVDADPWIRGLFMGKVEIGRAWAARGSGWGSEVTDEGWKGFREHLARARTHLEAAIAVDDTRPQPFVEMITVAMAQDEDARPWFDRALARQLDAPRARGNYGYSLRPRWGGSHGEMIALAAEALNGGRFDTGVPAVVIDTVDSITSDRDDAPLDDEMIARLDPLVTRCLDGYAKDSPLSGVRRWARSTRAAWAARIGRWDRVRAAFAEIAAANETPDPEPFEDWNLDAGDVAGEAAVRTGRPSADPALAALAETDPAVRAAALAAVLREPGSLDDVGRRWLAGRQADAQLAARIEAGGWVPVAVPRDLAGWRVIAGEWSVDADGALVGRASRGLSLLAPFDLPEGFEVRCVVAPVGESTDPKRVVRVAIAWARVDPIEIRLAFGEANGRLLRHYLYGQYPLAVDASGATTLHARVAGSALAALGTDGAVLAEHDFGGNMPSRRRLAFGGLERQTGPTWRLSRIEVRALPMGAIRHVAEIVERAASKVRVRSVR